jgi:GNAT superfamily N-acetyltransferase
VKIRPFDDRDVPGIATIVREAAPGWTSSEAGIRHRRESTPAVARRADWVAELDGEVAGFSGAHLETSSERGGVARLSVVVRPDRRRRGVGGALYACAEEHAVGIGARRLLADGRDDAGSRAFAVGRGFRHTMTRRLSSLDPRTVDPRLLVELAAEKTAEGFAVASFADFADRPELIHAVDGEAALDEPVDEPLSQMPFGEWRDRYWRRPDLSLDGSSVVVADGRPVAITEVLVDLDGGIATNGFTGTLRDYRGRGLARLAKLASIAWLREQGVATVVTGNDETNAAMLAVNRRLGYRPAGTWLSWMKDVG